MAERIERLNRYLRGWMNYFRHFPTLRSHRGVRRLAKAVDNASQRERERMCYWKQWRRPRTRIANLLKLGTTKLQAILTGISRKGYWRLSLA
jgi:RNA-directed DNA polymerase